ncbi:hypothetical protein REPUB_Repub13aG0063000 [Reevesia pubescens]
MASSSSSEYPTVSKQEIKLYHTIDRAIFARLLLKLRRDPGESMHVMALLIWLEHNSSHTGNLVYKIQSWPNTLIDALADEAVECLNCIRSDEDPSSHFPTGAKYVIPLIRRLTRDELSPGFFHDHRLDIIRGIVQLVQDVCIIAFDDIVEEALGFADEQRIEQNLQPLRSYGPLVRPNLPVYNCGVGEIGDQKMRNHQNFSAYTNTDGLGFVHAVNPNDRLSLRAQRESLNNEMEELLERIHSIRINSLEENNNEEVPADKRTIFLTFSKGYPISENEVKRFFTRYIYFSPEFS